MNATQYLDYLIETAKAVEAGHIFTGPAASELELLRAMLEGEKKTREAKKK